MPLLSENVFPKLLSVSRAIAGQMDYDAVLRAVAEELNQIIPYDHMDIVKLAHDGSAIIASRVKLFGCLCWVGFSCRAHLSSFTVG